MNIKRLPDYAISVQILASCALFNEGFLQIAYGRCLIFSIKKLAGNSPPVAFSR
ncbi:hypothetical protein ON064_03930 [Planococcus sp. A6]|uniref:hypothetical protein n=1 Tax=Planococcus sp. A6 TaxID=2992760 RepID=UPI00237C332F|nr:hypothetical protein [Planococcus sp. A6]MDE0582194.1 hypothetical protein [Planococcus sp. A6]